MNLQHDNLKTVNQLLSVPAGAEQQFSSAGECLKEFVDAGKQSECNDLVETALLLSNLCELADVTGEQEAGFYKTEIGEFIQEHLKTLQVILDGSLDSSLDDNNPVERMKREAEERWGECLKLVESNFAGEPCESDWSESSWDDCSLSGNADNPLATDDSADATASVEACDAQVRLMLAALETSNSETGNLETDTEPESTESATAEIEICVEAAAQVAVDADTFANAAETNESSELFEDPGLLEAYLDDAYRCLESMEQSLLALENSTEDREPLQQFCRELHTLKGASASVGLAKLATHLHQVESTAEVWASQSNEHELNVDSLLQAVDAVRSQVASLSSGSEASGAEASFAETAGPVASGSATSTAMVEQGNPETLSKQPGNVQACDAQATNRKSTDTTNFQTAGFQTTGETSVRVRASQLDRLMDMLAELVVLRNRRENHVSELSQLNDELFRCAARLQFAEDQPVSEQGVALEMLNGYSGSNTLSEVGKDITEISRDLRDLHKPVSVDNQAISQFIRHFRQELMALRRLPVSGLFKRLQRAARDAAKSEEKQIQIQVVGEENGLEQEIQEQLYEPLLHMVRNAVSHGIESSERRKRAGKNSIGSITLEAKSSANLLVIEVRDDGGGIDFEAVRHRAIDRGLLRTDHQASIHELSQLLFHPGFSTRSETSEISGRGFGMDIVATTVNQMHGRIEVDSKTGQGSTMRLLIPLRSGIEHLLVFRASGQLFALPMQSVTAAKCGAAVQQEMRKVSLAKLLSPSEIESQQDDNVLILRQKIGLMTSNSKDADERTENNDGRFALTVDEIVGPEEVVVRSLPALIQHHSLFCGVTLSGAGEMVLLLDSENLGQACLQTLADSQSAEINQKSWESDKLPQALVVDDSISARKSLARKLAGYGFAITEAGDGLEALELLRRNEYAVVMTDLDMPRLGGMELLADVQTGHYGSAPVVVVSSRCEQEFRSRALESGAAAYLHKPVTEESLANLMANLELELTPSC